MKKRRREQTIGIFKKRGEKTPLPYSLPFILLIGMGGGERKEG